MRMRHAGYVHEVIELNSVVHGLHSQLPSWVTAGQISLLLECNAATKS